MPTRANVTFAVCNSLTTMEQGRQIIDKGSEFGPTIISMMPKTVVETAILIS